MRIVCPACAATYDVPDSLVTPGRVVRCARCGGDWTPEAAVTAPEPEAPPQPLPPLTPVPAPPAEAREMLAEVTARQSAMNRLAAQPPVPRSSGRLRLAWAASVALLLLGAGAALMWRGEIVAAWPQSALAYAAFGMHPGTGSP